MAAALPPGAWWEAANRGGAAGPPEPYGPHAGDAAVAAARRGNLDIRGLSFAYPLRPNVPGVPPAWPQARARPPAAKARARRGCQQVTDCAARARSLSRPMHGHMRHISDGLDARQCRASNCVKRLKRRPRARRAVLKGLDLTLRRGTVTALVGHSGAGKSTVAALLSRFYEAQAGGVWLGGQPAAAFTRGEWARAVALVSQEPVLFAGARAPPGPAGRCSSTPGFLASQGSGRLARCSGHARTTVCRQPRGACTLVHANA
jgi:ABC-type multidrug transport system fused ATPase/permease subunit